MLYFLQPRNGREARKEGLAWLALAAGVLGVLFVSFLPSSDKRALHTQGRLHSWLHLAVFTAIGFIAERTASSPLARVAAFVGAVLFGFAIEVGEHLVYHGPLEWKDVVVDTMGVVAGTLFALLSGPARREIPQK